MSAAFSLTNTSDEWYEALTALCHATNGDDENDAQPMLRVTANSEVIATQNRPLQKERFTPEDGEICLLAAGGIRGVVLTPTSDKDGQCEMHLHVLASAADWALGFRILRDAPSHGATVTALATGEVLTAEKLTQEHAQQQQAAAWEQDQRNIAEQLDHFEANPDDEVDSHSAMLPLLGLALMVSSEELALPAEQLATLLVDRAHRYATAYQASLMSFPAPGRIKGPKGKPAPPVYLANFPHFATLIPKQVQALTFQGEAGSVVDAFVPLSTFLEHFPDQVEDAGEFHYVPAIDFSTVPDIVADFKKVQGSVDAPSAQRKISAQVRQMIFTQKTTGEDSLDAPVLTPLDWEFLNAIPSLLFLFVGGADGSITKEKRTAFARIIERLSHDDDKHGETMQRMIVHTQDEFANTLKRLTNTITHPKFYAESLGKLRVVLDHKLPAEEASKVKTACAALAKKIALSSGRMFGAKVAQEEKAAVNLVQQSLGVQ
ncbi:MAG: hypothetical protein ACI9R3_002526 [Verrucomicrobiales bacterium]|jgi:hypothetical protein